MSREIFFSKDQSWLIISIFLGFLAGLLISIICHKFNLRIMGVCIDVFIAPLVAGFVETFISNYTRKKSSGAISAIIIFFITNGIGWLFPASPLTLNIFTVGGFLLMLQAAFPSFINYLIIAIIFSLSYIFGIIGGFLGMIFMKKDNSTSIKDIDNVDKLGIHIFSSKPDIPIKEYHGIVFSEDVVEFEEKTPQDKVEYISSNLQNKQLLKYNDYSVARRYILHNLEKEAIKINANAIIDMEIEYTNYNQQLPPDVLVAAYGTAVTIDEKYLSEI